MQKSKEHLHTLGISPSVFTYFFFSCTACCVNHLRSKWITSFSHCFAANLENMTLQNILAYCRNSKIADNDLSLWTRVIMQIDKPLIQINLMEKESLAYCVDFVKGIQQQDRSRSTCCCKNNELASFEQPEYTAKNLNAMLVYASCPVVNLPFNAYSNYSNRISQVYQHWQDLMSRIPY